MTFVAPRLIAGLGRVELARTLSLADDAIERVERSVAALPSTGAADDLIAEITIPSTAAQDALRQLKRRV